MRRFLSPILPTHASNQLIRWLRWRKEQRGECDPQSAASYQYSKFMVTSSWNVFFLSADFLLHQQYNRRFTV
uniref:Uncharacterized protein n=1 Tax=Parascaris equorum TaxID=6256 RepID=A0A914RHU8_PAREQ